MTANVLRNLLSPVLAFAWLSFSARPAAAQAVDPERAAVAQSLFEEASAEMDRRQFSSACPKLVEVTRLIPQGLGAKLALGECYEGLGKLASAWSQYSLVESLAQKDGQAERAKEAGEKARALRPNLATLAIHVPDVARAITGLSIARDGSPVGEGQWDVPVPIDAGTHEVTVTAPGRQTSHLRVKVETDGLKREVTVTVPDSAMKPVTAPSPTWQRPTGIAAFGLGAAAIVAVGAGVGLMIVSTNKDVEANAKLDQILKSNAGACPCGSVEERAALKGSLLDHDRFFNAAVGLFIGAGVLGVGAAAFGVSTSLARPHGQAVRVVPAISRRSAGAVLMGSF